MKVITSLTVQTLMKCKQYTETLSNRKQLIQLYSPYITAYLTIINSPVLGTITKIFNSLDKTIFYAQINV